MTTLHEYDDTQTWARILNTIPQRLFTQISQTPHDLKQTILHDIGSGEYTMSTLVQCITSMAYFTDSKPDVLQAYKRACELLGL